MAPKGWKLSIDTPKEWRRENKVDENSPFYTSDESAGFANLEWWKQFDDPVLDGLIAEALANNLELKVALWRIAEFEALYRYVSGDFYPQITGSGFFSRQYASIAENPVPPGVSRYSNTYGLSLNGFYQIDLWGSVLNKSQAAFADFLSQIDARHLIIITVMRSVADSYVQLRKYDQQLQISKKTLESRLKALELAKVRYEYGYTSELEVKQAASAVAGAESAIAQLVILIAKEENLLSILVGRNPGPIVRGVPLEKLHLPPQIPVGLPSSLLGKRPDVLEAEHHLEEANALIGVARAAFFPNISLTGMLGTLSPELKSLFSDAATTWNYGGSALQTIFSGGKLIAQLDGAKAVQQEAYYRYEQVIQNAFREVNDALIAHQQSIELLKIEKEHLKILIDYLELAKLQYSNGQVDYLTVLDAERNSFEADLQVAQAESDTFTSLIDLYTALGGGWIVE